MTSRLLTFLGARQLTLRQRLAALVVLLSVAISRAPYVLFHGRFFAEEGNIYFSHMKSGGGLWFVAKPVGYIYAFCNVATWLAAHVPLQRAPLVTAWLSLGVIGLVIWAALSWPSELLTDARSRIAAATLLVIGPLAVPAVWLNTTNVQVYLGILAVLILFVDARAFGRRGFVGVAALLGLAGLSGLYAVTLTPLFLLRAFRERARRMKLLAGVISFCALAQIIVVAGTRASGNLAQGRGSFRGFGVMTRDIAAGHVSTFLFGSSIATRLNAHAYSFLGLLAFAFFGAVVALVLVLVLASTPRRRTALLLAGAFVLSEALVLFGTRGSTGGRYLVVPVAILLLIAVRGMSARNRLAAGIASAICVVAFVTGCSAFWTAQPRLLRCINCPEWSHQVRRWEANHARPLVIWPYGVKPPWLLRLPQPHAPAAGSVATERTRSSLCSSTRTSPDLAKVGRQAFSRSEDGAGRETGACPTRRR